MQEVNSFLTEMKDVYRKTLGRLPPDIVPDAYLPFPPGVDPVGFAIDEVKQLRQLADCTSTWPRGISWIPQTNTFTKDDSFVIEMDLAGMVRDDLSVSVQGDECIVRGERKPSTQEASARPLTSERTWGYFERRFSLPPNALPDGIKAKYVDGVLELKIPFDKAGKPNEKKIQIA